MFTRDLHVELHRAASKKQTETKSLTAQRTKHSPLVSKHYSMARFVIPRRSFACAKLLAVDPQASIVNTLLV